jgi:hypothetical protein
MYSMRAAALAVIVCLAPWTCEARGAGGVGAAVGEGRGSAPTLSEILAGYNDGIRLAMSAIETLTVEQEMVEPDEDGGDRRSVAILTYGRSSGMERVETSSELNYPAGEYTLGSLVGPELAESEYAVELANKKEFEGIPCYVLTVKALERDSGHFDGTVWVSANGFGLVRVEGSVADPPFPVSMITLDKVFELHPSGYRLLRRHTGRVTAQLGFIKKSGMRHIFYYGYSVEPAARELRGEANSEPAEEADSGRMGHPASEPANDPAPESGDKPAADQATN